MRDLLFLPKPEHVTMERGKLAADAVVQNRREGQLERYLAGLRKGLRPTAAALSAGYDDLGAVKRMRKEIPNMYELEREAEMQAAESVEDALYNAALAGNVKAIEMWLSNRSEERWRFGRQDTLAIEQKHVLELEKGERIERILSLINRLQTPQQAALPSGIIDVEEIPPDAPNNQAQNDI